MAAGSGEHMRTKTVILTGLAPSQILPVHNGSDAHQQQQLGPAVSSTAAAATGLALPTDMHDPAVSAEGSGPLARAEEGSAGVLRSRGRSPAAATTTVGAASALKTVAGGGAAAAERRRSAGSRSPVSSAFLSTSAARGASAVGGQRGEAAAPAAQKRLSDGLTRASAGTGRGGAAGTAAPLAPGASSLLTQAGALPGAFVTPAEARARAATAKAEVKAGLLEMQLAGGAGAGSGSGAGGGGAAGGTNFRSAAAAPTVHRSLPGSVPAGAGAASGVSRAPAETGKGSSNVSSSSISNSSSLLSRMKGQSH